MLQIGYASGKAPDKEEPEAEDRRLPNGKWLYEGKEYDYLIPTEIEEDFGVVRKLKLPYNKDSKSWTIQWHSYIRTYERCLPPPSPSPADPWVAARKFLQKHMLPLSQLEQVCLLLWQPTMHQFMYSNFILELRMLKPFCATPPTCTLHTPLLQVANHIQKVAGPYVYTGSDGAGLSDPFTGAGRYVPGTTGRQQYVGSGTDPFTGRGRGGTLMYVCTLMYT